LPVESRPLASLVGAVSGLPGHPVVALGAPFTVTPDLWYLLFIWLLGTHGFVELPPGSADYTAGHVAPLHRW
jgi:hypothetical protein